MFRRKNREIELERKNAILEENLKELSKREKQLNDIIAEMEGSIYKVLAQDGFAMVTSDSVKSGEAMEIDIFNLKTSSEEVTFSFTIKHPRTYR